MVNSSHALNLGLVLCILGISITVGFIEMFVIRYKNNKQRYKKY